MAILLETRNVRKVYTSGGGLFKAKTETVALDNFSLAVEDDSPIFTTIAGESGSGKTTLANLLLGFLTPTIGEVRFRGKNVWAMSTAERRLFHKEVQAIFQDPFEVYNPFYKIDHILTTPIKKFNLASNKTQTYELITTALRNVGLNPADTLGRYPHQLSGGQRQRVTIARALVLQPRIIIADEPVSMVDASLRATILESLRTLHRDFGISFIYITHDLTTAYQMSNNIVVLYRGAVAEAGDVENVIKHPQHPYTQELIASIPLPDPDQRWGQNGAMLQPAPDIKPTVSKTRNGCRYADRCPHVMPKCHEAAPPLYQTVDHQAVACYLYEQSPIVAAELLSQVLPKQGEAVKDKKQVALNG
ncbi:MAG: ABC transporter ATP-binding protein [Chloroflexi bacterium]|nr:ABC transporter ATP-binding protein [Chloroflexota bacterium]